MISYGILSFSSWLTSFSMMISSCIHVAANGIILFFFLTVIFHCTCEPHLLYPSSVDGHLGCFPVMAIVNNAAVNIQVQVSFWIRVFFSPPGYMPRRKSKSFEETEQISDAALRQRRHV